jgi:hypothetical protein
VKKSVPEEPRIGRPPASDQVTVMSVGPKLDTLRFVLSFDVVEHLLQIRDGPAARLGKWNWHSLRMQFFNFKDMTMPGVLVRLEPQGFDPRHPRLTKRKDGYRFTVQTRAKHIGVDNGVTTKKLDLLWADKQLGALILMFPEGDMLYAKKHGAGSMPPITPEEINVETESAT